MARRIRLTKATRKLAPAKKAASKKAAKLETPPPFPFPMSENVKPVAKKASSKQKFYVPAFPPSFDIPPKPASDRLAKIIEENLPKGEIRIPGKRTTKLASAPKPTLDGAIAHDFKVIPKEKKPPRESDLLSTVNSLFGGAIVPEGLNRSAAVKLVITPSGVSVEENLDKDLTKEDFAKSLESATATLSSMRTDGVQHPDCIKRDSPLGWPSLLPGTPIPEAMDAVTASISGKAQAQQTPEEARELSDLYDTGSKWTAYSPAPSSDMIDELLKADKKEEDSALAVKKAAVEAQNKEFEERAAKHKALHDGIKFEHDKFLAVWDKDGFIKADLVRDISAELIKRIASSDSFQVMTAKLYEEASRYSHGLADLSTSVQLSVSVTEQAKVTDTPDILVGVDFRNLIMP